MPEKVLLCGLPPAQAYRLFDTRTAAKVVLFPEGSASTHVRAMSKSPSFRPICAFR